MTLEPFLDEGLLKHEGKEKHSLILSSSPKTDDIWKTNFISTFTDKIISQIQQIKIESIDKLAFTASFGHFYLINSSKTFASQNKMISISDLEHAIGNGRKNRSVLDQIRTEYDPTSKVLNDINISDNFSSNTFKVCSNQGNSFNNSKSISTSQLKSVGCSFHPSVLEPKKDKSESRSDEYINKKMKSLMIILKSLGYTEIENLLNDMILKNDGNKIPGTEIHVPNHTWNVELIGSKSYSTNAFLNEDLNMIKLQERPLNWVFGTLLGNSQSANDTKDANNVDNLCSTLLDYDLRLKLHTTEKLSPENSKIYKKFCGDGSTSLLEIDDITKNPKPSSDLINKNDICFARKIIERHFFLNTCLHSHLNEKHDDTFPPQSSPKILITVVKSNNFQGDNLENCEKFLEVSISVDPTYIRSWLKAVQPSSSNNIVNEASQESDIVVSPCEIDGINLYFKEALDEILSLSEKLKDLNKNF